LFGGGFLNLMVFVDFSETKNCHSAKAASSFLAVASAE
jgi:hypothetical protein